MTSVPPGPVSPPRGHSLPGKRVHKSRVERLPQSTFPCFQHVRRRPAAVVQLGISRDRHSQEASGLQSGPEESWDL